MPKNVKSRLGALHWLSRSPDLAIYDLSFGDTSNIKFGVYLKLNSQSLFSLRKTVGKSVTDSGYAYVTQ